MAGLSVLQQLLEEHFASLRAKRDEEVGPAFPIFALEHGLGETEMGWLKTAVRDAVRRHQLPAAASLPFVVYAAEVGYDYAGEEYWQTFSSRTPGWAQLEDRHFIRSSFVNFADRFGGARPAGPWADHFTIICWPITHAVLPTDLQQQLVQLIFDYRRALTSDLLADPEALGVRLAARSGNSSSRFRYFAQNTGLLGQVAAALLVAENESSPYLSEATLRRIAESLSVHHQARRWLRDVKSVASRVRTQGFLPPARAKADTTRGPVERLAPATDADLTLQLTDQGWAAYVELPDLSVLAERLPELHEQLARARVHLAGHTSGALARGRLLVSGQRVRLDEWPDTGQPLLQVEGNSMEQVNRLLADQCVLSPGPAWLFRVRERGLATEVKGKRIHPGHPYVLLVRAGVPTDARPAWASPIDCVTNGVIAFSVQAPEVLSEEDRGALVSLCLGVTADVTVHPAGVFPSSWDGEGVASWLVGDDVIVAVSSEHAVTSCLISLDGSLSAVEWPENTKEIFLSLTGLSIGPHRVEIALVGSAVDDPMAEGSLDLRIDPPHARSAGGTLREGLVLLAEPRVPTLDEMWNGRATVELLGPDGTEITMGVSLLGGTGTVLSESKFKVHAPLDDAAWRQVAATHLRGSEGLWGRYDEADLLVLTASHPELGTAELRCEREFTPLRWVVRRDREGPFARLIDHSERSKVEVARYGFSTPSQRDLVEVTDGTALRWPDGGLLEARVNDFEAAIVLPPHVSDLADLRRTRITPSIATGPPTPLHLVSLVRQADLWMAASLPGDPFAQHERRAVLRSFACRFASDAGGGRWARLEESGVRDDRYSFGELRGGVGAEPYQEALAQAIGRRLRDWYDLHPEKRTVEFAAVLSMFKHRTQVAQDDHRFAEFLLRAASELGTLSNWPDEELNRHIERMRTSPVLIRAARFTVLAIHLDLDEDDGTSSYRGWAWP